MDNSVKAVLVAVFAMVSLSAWAGKTNGPNQQNNKLTASHDCGCHADSRSNPKDQDRKHQTPGSPGGSKPARGMPTYSFASATASLSVKDTPINYTPPVGPSLDTTLYYNQRDAQQPVMYTAFNVSHEWTMNWLSYIQDDPLTPGHSVLRYVAGGGTNTYSGYNSSTGAFTAQHDGVRLVMTSADPITYALYFPNGAKDVFAASNGKTTYPREVYLSKVVDPQGNAVTLHYDAQMRLTAVTDAIGQSVTFEYADTSNPMLVTGITDPFGRQATIGYNNQGQLDSITDEIGMTSTFVYADFPTAPPIIAAASVSTDGTAGPSPGGPPIILTNLGSMTTPYGTTHFSTTAGSYGDATELSIQATDPLGYTERTEYHIGAPGIPFSVSNAPSGMNIFNAYLNYRDSFFWNKDEFAAACSGSGVTLKCDYGKARMKHFLHEYPCCEYTSVYLENVRYPLESMIWYDYAGQSSPIYPGTVSKPTHIGRVLDNGKTQLTTYTHNAWGNVTSGTDPDGRVTTYTYAPNGIDLIAVQQKDGAAQDTIAQYTYNGQHEPLTYIDAAGKTTTYTYNARGQRTSVTDPLGNTTTYTYDGNGYLTTITDALGVVQRRVTYDSDGRVATVTDSRGYTARYSYDALNRITQIAYPDGTTRRFVWNKLDLASVTDRRGRTTAYTYDADRNLVAVTDPMGHVTRMTYYPSGKLHTLTDPKGNTTTWTRDIEGRVIAKTYADGKGDTYTYDNTSRLASKIDALGQKTTYTYDPDDLLTGISYSNAVNPTANVLYRYSPYYPRMLNMTDGLGTTTFNYGPVGTPGALKLQSEAGPFGANDTVSYAYDADGRLASRTTDQSDTFTYDALGRVAAEVNPLGSFTDRYFADTDQLRLERMIQPDGRRGYSLTVGYDGNLRDRQLSSLIYGGTSPFTERMQFTHSADHQLLGKHTYTGPSPLLGRSRQSLYTYGYDADSRLTNVKFDALFPAGQYSYDAAGNLLQYQDGATFNAAANDLNQLSIVNGKAWQYDADGNLINDGQHAYAWDAANRLVKVTNLKTGDVTTYGYDGLGRRLTIGTQATGGTNSKTFYLWCGNTLCGARNAANQVIADYYAQGEQQDHYTQAGQQSTDNLYYMKDQIGSVVGVIAANGELRGSTDYTAYGAVRKTVGMHASFGYAGMFYDATTGLYLTKYREYAPSAGRWLSRDPIGMRGGEDIYAYVGGDPQTLRDPTGQGPVLALVGGAIGYAWGVTDGYLSGDRGEQLWLTDGGAGALTGGLAGLTDGLSLAEGIAARSAISMGVETYREVANGMANGCVRLNAMNIGVAGLSSAFGDLVGSSDASQMADDLSNSLHWSPDPSPLRSTIVSGNAAGAMQSPTSALGGQQDGSP